MKELYHGTITEFVPSILKEGLTPEHINQRWNATKIDFFGGFNPAKEDPMGYVYVLDWRGMAASYAKAKADYYRVLPGEVFNTAHDVPFRKEADAPVIRNAEPAVLKITLPNEFPIEIDEQDFDGFRYKGVIPAQYIKLISYNDSLGIDRTDPHRAIEIAALKDRREKEIDDALSNLILSTLLKRKLVGQ